MSVNNNLEAQLSALKKSGMGSSSNTNSSTSGSSYAFKKSSSSTANTNNDNTFSFTKQGSVKRPQTSLSSLVQVASSVSNNNNSTNSLPSSAYGDILNPSSLSTNMTTKKAFIPPRKFEPPLKKQKPEPLSEDEALEIEEEIPIPPTVEEKKPFLNNNNNKITLTLKRANTTAPTQLPNSVANNKSTTDSSGNYRFKPISGLSTDNNNNSFTSGSSSKLNKFWKEKEEEDEELDSLMNDLTNSQGLETRKQKTPMVDMTSDDLIFDEIPTPPITKVEEDDEDISELPTNTITKRNNLTSGSSYQFKKLSNSSKPTFNSNSQISNNNNRTTSSTPLTNNTASRGNLKNTSIRSNTPNLATPSAFSMTSSSPGENGGAFKSYKDLAENYENLTSQFSYTLLDALEFIKDLVGDDNETYLEINSHRERYDELKQQLSDSLSNLRNNNSNFTSSNSYSTPSMSNNSTRNNFTNNNNNTYNDNNYNYGDDDVLITGTNNEDYMDNEVIVEDDNQFSNNYSNNYNNDVIYDDFENSNNNKFKQRDWDNGSSSTREVQHVDTSLGVSEYTKTNFEWSKKVEYALKETFGISSFRKNQLEAVNAALAGRDVL
ncbi:hypothetical protein ABK040_015112 [Willaertia magna]